MKGTSKVIMGATLVMVLSLAIVLGLILVLLAELYCSILLRRRQLNQSKANVSSTSAIINVEAAPRYPSPLSSFYAQGVLQAPRSFLFPNRRQGSFSDEVEMQHGKLHQFLSLQTALESAMTSPSSPPPIPPTTVNEISEIQKPQPAPPLGVTEQLVYICNPIYENDGLEEDDDDQTPFETPDTSPTRLNCPDEINVNNTITPPLTPIKLAPAKASLGTSGSESNSTQNAAFSPSLSGSHSTSSW